MSTVTGMPERSTASYLLPRDSNERCQLLQLEILTATYAVEIAHVIL